MLDMDLNITVMNWALCSTMKWMILAQTRRP
jgi:hypothetical protein